MTNTGREVKKIQSYYQNKQWRLTLYISNFWNRTNTDRFSATVLITKFDKKKVSIDPVTNQRILKLCHLGVSFPPIIPVLN